MFTTFSQQILCDNCYLLLLVHKKVISVVDLNKKSVRTFPIRIYYENIINVTFLFILSTTL